MHAAALLHHSNSDSEWALSAFPRSGSSGNSSVAIVCRSSSVATVLVRSEASVQPGCGCVCTSVALMCPGGGGEWLHLLTVGVAIVGEEVSTQGLVTAQAVSAS